jgi:cullin 1
MYSLLSRIPEGLEPLQKKFEQHIEKTGLAAISKLVGEAGSSTESLDPKIYVDALLEIHQKYSETVTKSFRGDSGFVESLDKACREFVNRNAVTSQSNSTSSELFSDYLDLLLRKNNNLAGKGDLEMALNRVVRCRILSSPRLIFILLAS